MVSADFFYILTPPRFEVSRFKEPRGPQPPASGGPLFAFAHSRGRSAGCCPKFAPKSQKIHRI